MVFVVATVISSVLLSGTLAADGGTFRAHAGNHTWTNSEGWNTGRVPDGRGTVLVPGWDGESTIRIPNGTTASAGALIIGGRLNATGSVEAVQGSLRLDAGTITGVTDAGRMYVGHDGGSGTFLQSGGLVSVHKAIRIADGSTSVGRYILNGGTLQARAGLVVTTNRRSTGVFEINGSNVSIKTKAYLHGKGNASLRMTADSLGFGKIVATKNVTLSGTLFVDMNRYSTSTDEIILIDNGGEKPIQGGFSSMTLLGADGYEISYTGGDGNDLVLQKTTLNLNSFTEWAKHHLGSVRPGRKGLYDDDDFDGVGNLAEYKLGSLPLRNEDWDLTAEKSEGRWRYRYTEDRLRADAVIVPQVDFDGVWRSDRMQIDVIEETESTRLMEFSFEGQRRPIRLHAELLPDPTKPTNVMLIVVDDLNDWVGCLGGHPQAFTPHIDALAARGVLFTDAHCSAVNCNASRTSFLTGMMPSSTGVYSNSTRFRTSDVIGDALTLPEWFRANGYAAEKAGKVFHRHQDIWTGEAPLRSDVGEIHNPSPPKTSRGHKGLDWAAINRPDEDFFDHKVATWVTQNVANRDAAKPYFMITGLYRPHLPWYAPQRFYDRNPLADVVLPETLDTDLADMPAPVFNQVLNVEDNDSIVNGALNKAAVQAYLSTTSFADEQVGRVMAALDNQPTLRNTVIVLISDHGFHLGEKAHWRKQSLWTESTRVPMIVVAPGVTSPGSRVDEPASLLDVYPTLVELAGLEPPEHLEGVSMVPILRDTKLAKNRYVYTSRLYRQTSIRDAQYHYIRYANGDSELYDHIADPHLFTNLALNPAYDNVERRMRNNLPEVNVLPPDAD